MSKLFITVGLPASGKSTYSKKWVEESPKTRVRVNRDDIRRMLGPYWIPTREGLVTLIENTIIVDALESGFDVIVYATNFKGTDRFHQIITEAGIWDYMDLNEPISTIQFTNVSVEECISRDSKRDPKEQVGKEVIINMAKKYLNYKDE
jgi:predicted kinase